MVKGNLLESSTGAYIEWWVKELMRLLIKIEYKDALLVIFLQMHILGAFSFLLSGKSC